MQVLITSTNIRVSPVEWWLTLDYALVLETLFPKIYGPALAYHLSNRR